jgi:hypothetical protein
MQMHVEQLEIDKLVKLVFIIVLVKVAVVVIMVVKLVVQVVNQDILVNNLIIQLGNVLITQVDFHKIS